MSAAPFHFTFSKKAREGVYHLRVYSIPPDAIRPKLRDHWQYLDENNKPVELPGSVITSFAPHQVESESEFEQGIPRLGELSLELEPVPELAALIAATRDPSLDIWIEITLEQPILDAPDYPGPTVGSLTWPWKTRSYFWGPLDRKTVKGKVYSQQTTTDALDSFIRKTKTHDGTLTMSFIHWLKQSSEGDAKAMLDSIVARVGISGMMSIGSILLQIINYLNPAPVAYIADVAAKPQQTFLTPSSSEIGGWNHTLDFSVAYDGTTFHKDVDDIFIKVGGAQCPLFFYDAKGSGDDSLYKWKDLAEALTVWSRELFLNVQIEIPTMAATAPVKFPFYDNAQTFEGSARVLVQNDSEALLPLYADIDEETLEYDPCATYASSYTVSEPTLPDLLPDPAQTITVSPFRGGADQSYKTLLRLMGFSNATPSLPDPRGWELYVKDGSGNFHAAQSAMYDGVTFTDWTNVHAHQKINAWGGARAIVSFTARGVGLQPFGVACTSSGTAITLPAAHYGLMDFGEFPLRRSMNIRPGIFADPRVKPDTTIVTFITISVKRVPDGGTEYKMIELIDNTSLGIDSILAPPPPPPPPPPGKRGGPSDAPAVSISPTGLTGPLAGTHTISVTATNTYGVAQVTVRVDGQIIDTQISERAADVWSFDFDTTKFSGTLASPQIHTVKAIGYDVGGNTGTATLAVTVAN